MGRIHGHVDTETRADLLDLIVEFTWKLDHDEPAGFADLFTADGTFLTDEGRIEGAAALQDFADHHTSMEQVSRGVLTNHRLVRLSESTIEGTVLVTLYLGQGAAPAESVPYSVSEYRDVYVRVHSGDWRIKERRSLPIFARTA